MDGVLTQIGEAAADVELAGGGVLDISVQPYRAAAALACRAQRGVDEEPRDPAPLEAGQNPEGMDDQHLPRCGVVRPGGLLGERSRTGVGADRTSTRLNSRHVAIPYASLRMQTTY